MTSAARKPQSQGTFAAEPEAEPSAKPEAGSQAEPSGELALIERIRQRAGTTVGRELRLGIGDDCAIVSPRPGEEMVVTTDFSLEGRHFRRDWHPPASIGHRTLARGLSDLAAMGARPVAAFLSLALPRVVAQDTAWMEGFFDGLLALAKRAPVPLAGGDTAEAPGAEVLADIVLLGAAPAGRALRRDGARPGDRLFCTGLLGGAAAELEATTRAHAAAAPAQRLAEAPGFSRKVILPPNPHPHFYPEPRLDAGQALLRRGLATAAIDLSDGLSTDLAHVCEASGVAAEIESAKLPLHPLAAALEPEAGLAAALHGGEDYELLFAARPGASVPKRLGGVPLTEIGRCLAPRRGQPVITIIGTDGRRAPLLQSGWEHLR